MKRYQVYLNPQSINTLDEAAKLIEFTRSEIIREAVDGAAGRIGNLMAKVTKRTPQEYLWFKNLIGSTTIKGKKKVKISEKVDELYYS
jgi:hypothetical protein